MWLCSPSEVGDVADIAEGTNEEMSIRSKLAGGLAVTAFMLASASPAAARGWYNGYDYGHHRHHDSTGAVIGTIAAVGVIAAIVAAASSNRNRQTAPQSQAPRYDDGSYDNAPRYDEQSAPAPSGQSPTSADSRYPGDRYAAQGYGDAPAAGTGVGEDAAVNACALAARDEGSRGGLFASVRQIGQVDPIGTGWDVRGSIDQRENVRSVGQLRDFRCTYQNGRVSAVSLN